MKNHIISLNFSYKLVISIILVLSTMITYSQTEKGRNMLLLHNYSPSGMRIDDLPLTLFPQTNGLGFSISSHKVKLNGNRLDVHENVLTYGLSVSGHQFIFDNLSLGLTGSVYSGTTTYKESDKADEKYTTTLFMAGPEIRYYLHGGRSLKFWLKACPSLGSINSTYDGKDLHVPKRLYQFSGALGFSYFLSSSFSMDMGLTYNVFTIRNHGNYNENSRKELVDGIGLDIGFGFFF